MGKKKGSGRRRQPEPMKRLQGYAVHYTERAVKWADRGSGFELWFPISRALHDGDDLLVPERMYAEQVSKAKVLDAEAAIEDAREDARIEREQARALADYQRDMAKLGYDVSSPRRARRPTGCLLIFAVPAAAAAWLFL